MNNPDRAVAIFDSGLNCAQAVLATYAPALGLECNAALRVASAFGAGMNRAETCGAVTGALMVLGLRHGRTRGDDLEAKRMCARMTDQFCAQFRAQHKAVCCKELLGCDISQPGQMAAARERGLFRTECPKFVRSAAEILDRMCEGRPPK